ncbi:hypothetical protein DD237_007227 [Peronospora effusa]|uniref:Nudix hydrolase domain-containing protein n=1 Tax=Peronospora effusa TaxID=542832 RepID=A0A3R7Y4L1_9STRA|nr:hypothetical protein DD237_007227 [Peronospora effusa]
MRRRLMSFSVCYFKTPLAMDQVIVSLSSCFNRLPHPDTRFEQLKMQTWDQLKRKTPRLFNASKFRLQQITLTPSDHHSLLTLHLGITDYASYVGMCCSSLTSQLVKDGEQLHGDRFAFLSRKVGVAAVVETVDGHVALIKRSKNVGLYQNMYDTPGGHPEPSNIQLTEDSLHMLKDKKKTEMEKAARREFFQSIVHEVHEELNVAPELQQLPMLLGVVLQTDACTPSFSFHIKIKCSAHELKELYKAGPMDKFESVELEFLTVENLLMEGSTILEELQLTPSAKGTLEMWKQHTLQAK